MEHIDTRYNGKAREPSTAETKQGTAFTGIDAMNWMRRFSTGDTAAASTATASTTTGTSLHAAVTSTKVAGLKPILSPIAVPDPFLFVRTSIGSTETCSCELDCGSDWYSAAGAGGATTPLSSSRLDREDGESVTSPDIQRWTLAGYNGDAESRKTTMAARRDTKEDGLPPDAARRTERFSSMQYHDRPAAEQRTGWRDISTLASPNATSHAIRIPDSGNSLQRSACIDPEIHSSGIEMLPYAHTDEGAGFVFEHESEEDVIDHLLLCQRRATETPLRSSPWASPAVRRAASVSDAHAAYASS